MRRELTERTRRGCRLIRRVPDVAGPVVPSFRTQRADVFVNHPRG
jgi:hypothetical protein